MNLKFIIGLLGVVIIILISLYFLSNSKNSEIILEFPKDEGMHTDVKHEWWYFNGHVCDEKGNHYGLMVCFFKNGKLYLEFADENNSKFYSAIIHGNLKASQEKLDISIGNNWWVETDKSSYKMHTEYAGTHLDLNMITEKPPLLIGGQGLVLMGRGGTSYYYSQTRLKINGKLKLMGEEKNISGIGWIDRQWGNWNFDGFDGWEWFSIQLDNNEEIQLFKLFDPETGESITPMLNIMHANNEQETINSFQIEYLDYWTDPKSGDRFSHKWKIKIPEKDIELVVIPTIDDQLIHQGLWEGSCTVTGKVGNEDVTGWGYVELTRRW